MTSGLEFPLRITSLGRFSTLSDTDKIVQNLQRIASTSLNERWYESDFGTIGYDMLFENPTRARMTQAAALIELALNEQELRARSKVSWVEDQSTDGKIVFLVLFRIRDSQVSGRTIITENI